MNGLIKKIYDSKSVEDSAGNSRDAFPSGIFYEDGTALYRIIREGKARNTLEIGFGYGLSTLFMLQAHADNGGGHHTAIDPWQEKWFDNIGLLNVNRAGLEKRFSFVRKPSYTALPESIERGERFDAIFIDGSHRFDATIVDFFLSDKLLNTQGHMILHDPWLPSVRRVLTFITRNFPDSYELANNFMPPPKVGPAGAGSFLSYLLRNPFSFQAARVWAGFRKRTYCVLRKTAGPEEENVAAAWDYYRSF